MTHCDLYYFTPKYSVLLRKRNVTEKDGDTETLQQVLLFQPNLFSHKHVYVIPKDLSGDWDPLILISSLTQFVSV